MRSVCPICCVDVVFQRLRVVLCSIAIIVLRRVVLISCSVVLLLCYCYIRCVIEVLYGVVRLGCCATGLLCRLLVALLRIAACYDVCSCLLLLVFVVVIVVVLVVKHRLCGITPFGDDDGLSHHISFRLNISRQPRLSRRLKRFILNIKPYLLKYVTSFWFI